MGYSNPALDHQLQLVRASADNQESHSSNLVKVHHFFRNKHPSGAESPLGCLLLRGV